MGALRKGWLGEHKWANTNEANNFMKGCFFTISGARQCGIWSRLEFLIWCVMKISGHKSQSVF